MDIEARLRLMEDIQEITRLKTRYTIAADSNAGRPHSGNVVADLFVADGVWHIVPMGPPVTGRAAIKAHFDDAALIPFSYHHLGNPLIEVNGDRARGQWHVMVMFTAREVGRMWVAGNYDDEFVRTADGWRFQVLRCTADAMAPYGEGW